MFQPFPLNCLENSKANLEKIINEADKNIENLLKIKNKNYKNFVKPLMEVTQKIEEFFTPISHLNSVNDSEKSREAFSSSLPILIDYSTRMSQNKEIYNSLIEINKDSKLNSTEKKVVTDSLTSFKLEGVDLDEDQKNRIKEINTKISELSDLFSKNLLDDTNKYELLLKEDKYIKNMPESDKEAAKVENGWKFTLQAPSYISFMTYCDNRKLREKAYKAYMTRAPQNGIIIEELLKLKDEKAKILGFNSYAELKNKKMSAPSVNDIYNFLESLVKAGKPYGKKELDELKKFALTKGYETVESYDISYISNLMKKEMLNFDNEMYRPYFEQSRVVNGLFLFLNKLFGIEFKKIENTPLWNEKATCYDLSINSEVVGRLYLDLEARKEKRSGAWMNNWYSGRIDDKCIKHLPTAFIVCNFPPTTASHPSLLRHDDVNTLFHEVGHAIHHLLSKVTEADLSGVNGVEWDAIEFPSQFLENFSYEPKVLNLFAVNHYTNEKLSEDMIKKLVDNKNFQSGIFLLRQLEFSLFDMKIHEKPYTEDEVNSIISDIRKQIAVITPPDYIRFQNGFSHIFAGGYSAGYYSYKWAEMLSADAYLTFSEKSVFDKKIANSFLENILFKGGSDSMNNLFLKFMKRKPDPKALIKLLGLN